MKTIEQAGILKIAYLWLKQLYLTDRFRVKIIRSDSIPGFGAYAKGSVKEGEALVLLNVEACMASAAHMEGEPLDVLISTMMHEFGHALEDHFDLEYDEEMIAAASNTYDGSEVDTGEDLEAKMDEMLSIIEQYRVSLTEAINKPKGTLPDSVRIVDGVAISWPADTLFLNEYFPPIPTPASPSP